MSLTVVHLRWDGVAPEQFEQLRQALPDGASKPTGCLLRQRRLQGRAVLATEVWSNEELARAFLADLPQVLGPVAAGEPQVVVFALHEAFAAGYGLTPAQVHATMTGAAPPVVIPAPRPPMTEPVTAAPGSAGPG